MHPELLHLIRVVLTNDELVARPESAEYDKEIKFVRKEDLAAVRDAPHGQNVQFPSVSRFFRLSGVSARYSFHQIFNHSRDVPEDLRRFVFLPFQWLNNHRMLVDEVHQRLVGRISIGDVLKKLLGSLFANGAVVDVMEEVAENGAAYKSTMAGISTRDN